MTVLWNLLFFLIVIGIVVSVHEFGHFYAARRFGVKVQRFSIGFGKVLLRWQRGETEYALSMIPLGGYVAMPVSKDDQIPESEKHRCIDQKPVWQRMVVSAAGPLANFALALVVVWLMLLKGIPTLTPAAAEIKANSIAANASFPTEQKIIAVNGNTVHDWQDFQLLMLESLGDDSAEVTLLDDNTQESRRVRLDLSTWQLDPEKQTVYDSLGIVPVMAQGLLEVARVESGSAADQGGLRVDDQFVAVDGVPLANWPQLQTAIQQRPNQAMVLTIQRQGALQDVTVTPQGRTVNDGSQRGFLGVSPKVKPVDAKYQQLRQFDVFMAVPEAFADTWQLVRNSFSMFGKLLTGQLSLRHLSGPVSIADGAGTSASFGLIAFLSYLAIISVNIGAVNLLPLPILDGGHLMYLVVELIRGKPVSEKAQEVGLRFGAFLLLMLMGIALLNDFSRYL